jgi:hypothetical protein
MSLISSMHPNLISTALVLICAVLETQFKLWTKIKSIYLFFDLNITNHKHYKFIICIQLDTHKAIKDDKKFIIK